MSQTVTSASTGVELGAVILPENEKSDVRRESVRQRGRGRAGLGGAASQGGPRRRRSSTAIDDFASQGVDESRNGSRGRRKSRDRGRERSRNLKDDASKD